MASFFLFYFFIFEFWYFTQEIVARLFQRESYIKNQYCYKTKQNRNKQIIIIIKKTTSIVLEKIPNSHLSFKERDHITGYFQEEELSAELIYPSGPVFFSTVSFLREHSNHISICLPTSRTRTLPQTSHSRSNRAVNHICVCLGLSQGK